MCLFFWLLYVMTFFINQWAVIFYRTSAWGYKPVHGLKDPFKVQDRLKDFNVHSTQKFIDTVSYSTLQLSLVRVSKKNICNYLNRLLKYSPFQLIFIMFQSEQHIITDWV